MARVPRPFLKRLLGFSCFGRLIEKSQPETVHPMASRSVGVSAVTGAGCEDFEKAMVEACKELWAMGNSQGQASLHPRSRQEFEESYVPFLLEQRRDLEAKRRAAVEEQAGNSGRDATCQSEFHSADVASAPGLWRQKHTVKVSGHCLHHGFRAKNTRRPEKASTHCLHHGFGDKNTGCRQAAVAFTLAFWRQKHTVKASGRCPHHGFCDSNIRSGRCLHHDFATKTHGEGKRSLPSPWFWRQKHTVKASRRCLHHEFGDKNIR